MSQKWHIGSAIVLPVRSFALGGGASAPLDREADDVFVSHAFQGTWKQEYQRMKAQRLEADAARDASVPPGRLPSKEPSPAPDQTRCANGTAGVRVCACCAEQTSLHHLIDGNTYSKWTVAKPGPALNVTLELSSSSVIEEYYLASAGDHFPTSWYACVDNRMYSRLLRLAFVRTANGEWLHVDEQRGFTEPRRYRHYRFPFKSPVEDHVTALRLTFNPDGQLQISELGVLERSGDVIPLPPTPLLSAANLAFKPASNCSIPNIIHQTWKSEMVPSSIQGYVKSWLRLHPQYEYRFWTDDQNLELLKKHYPWFVPTYQAYSSPGQRADAIRYFILYHFGGLYVDADFEALKPADDLLANHTAVFGTEPQAHAHLLYNLPRLVSNAFMATCRNHPVLREVKKNPCYCHHSP